MITLGIFDKVFDRPTFGETLDAAVAAGFTAVQLHLDADGLDAMPLDVPSDDRRRIRAELDRRGLAVAGLSATYNMAHPDPAVRRDGLARLAALAEAAPDLGADLLTLCTGTRDPLDKWRFHPDNATPEAWADLLAGMAEAVALAERHGVLLGVEPEPANVVRDAPATRRLIDELRSDRVKVIFDPANVVAGALDAPPLDTLARALDLLAPDLAAAHGKDVDPTGRFVPLGDGIVPWPDLLPLLHAAGYTAPLTLHSLTEADVPRCRDAISPLLRERGHAVPPSPRGEG